MHAASKLPCSSAAGVPTILAYKIHGMVPTIMHAEARPRVRGLWMPPLHHSTTSISCTDVTAFQPPDRST